MTGRDRCASLPQSQWIAFGIGLGIPDWLFLLFGYILVTTSVELLRRDAIQGLDNEILQPMRAAVTSYLLPLHKSGTLQSHRLI